jgi:hypothetical protein
MDSGITEEWDVDMRYELKCFTYGTVTDVFEHGNEPLGSTSKGKV